MNFVKASLKYKQVTLSVLILLFIAGINSLINMPRREDPKITIPAGLITAWYPGADAVQVEEEVTLKLEEYIFRFEEVEKDKTHSTTTDGKVVVNIWLRDNVRQPDIFWSKLRHELMVIKTINLPAGVRGPVVNSDFGDTEAVVIAVSGKEASYDQLRESAVRMEKELRKLTAASKIKRIGEQKEEVTISYDSNRLSQYGIGLNQVVKVLQSQNSVNPTGSIGTGDTDTPLYTGGTYKTIDDIGNQIVGASGTGAVIRLKDIATLKRDYAKPTEKISVNGEKAVLLTIQMHEGNNIVKFGKDVQKTIGEVSRQLPGSVKLTTIVDQPRIVNENVTRFLREFLMAIAAVILVVFLMLPLSIATVAALAIPMTISVTF
jgi:multidrug efflux pump subunit AcrB